ncbi:hypothetical protein HPB49_025566 [Dermacentor silvarum]|uniref:Uncharacterized protein n=1 Tax=Dermacentor silvarum TaxID=543639 RepID=A0ACB8DLR4_DERSI|nr:hypothetical protein HPB49_025566 [Dermacentor silvarum]
MSELGSAVPLVDTDHTQEAATSPDSLQPQNVAIRDQSSPRIVAAVWCVGALVGFVAGLLPFAVVSYLRGGESETLLPLPPPERDDGSVCYTPGCLATADYLWDALNPLVEPCRNFEEHVCGRFGELVGGSVSGLGQSIVNREFALAYLRLGLVAERYALTRSSGARHKAATLLRDCRTIGSSRRSHHNALRQFMRTLDLFLFNPPPSAPTSADHVLALHVELAYAYGLSAVLRIRPNVAHSLAVEFNEAHMKTALLKQPDAQYTINLMVVAGVAESVELLQLKQSLHNAMVAAVADAISAYHGSVTETTPMVVKKVEDLSFTGVSTSAFGDAIEAKTPYARNTSVLESRFLKSALESVWKHMAVPNLFLWTSWNVLERVAPFVEPSLTGSPGSATGQAFAFYCLQMVAHVMEPALAALVYVVTDKDRAEITAMANAIASCLSNKSRWLSAFSTSPPLVVGLPSYADSVERLDAFYASFPTPRGSFFEDWLSAAKAWRQRISPNDSHFDPLDGDVEVAADGTLLIPAALLTVPFYSSDGTAAANLGGLGHLIARRLVIRYFVAGAASVPAECRPPPGSPTAGVFENLLAYECVVGSAFDASNASRDPRLPRLPSLSPARMVYTAGCLKDCAVRNGGPASCRAPMRLLGAFDEAFSCASAQPLCSLS